MLLHHLQELVGSYGTTNELKADHAPTAAAKELLHPSIAGVADEARVVHPGHLQSTPGGSADEAGVVHHGNLQSTPGGSAGEAGVVHPGHLQSGVSKWRVKV